MMCGCTAEVNLEITKDKINESTSITAYENVIYTKDILSKLLLVWAHFVIHVSYGLGFWAGIFKFLSVKFN